MRSRLFAFTILIAFVFVLTFVVIGTSATNASQPPSPSPSCSPSPTPTPTATCKPPSSNLLAWAKKWRKIASNNREALCKVRSCLNGHAPVRLTPTPSKQACAKVWKQIGKRWKHQAKNWRIQIEDGIDKMKNPGGSGCERWRPLVRYIWPASCVNKVLSIMKRESRGNPRILCGGYVLPRGAGDGKPDKRAGGLMQNKPAPRHWADPFFNLWYAFHHKYLPALRAWGNGWFPWAASGAV